MNRRQQLENILIGTLLESTEERNFYLECCCMVTEDMIQDGANRRIYHIIAEMNAKGMQDTRPTTIFETYGDSVIDLLPDMTERCANDSIIEKKMQYNKVEHLKSYNEDRAPRYTDVDFTVYVTEFLKYVYEEERGRNKAA